MLQLPCLLDIAYVQMTMKSEVCYYLSCLQQLLYLLSDCIVCIVHLLTAVRHADIKYKDDPITFSATASHFANVNKLRMSITLYMRQNTDSILNPLNFVVYTTQIQKQPYLKTIDM